MAKRVIRRQKPVAGGRHHLSPSVIAEIAQQIEQTARKFSVSRSFVISVALGEAFGIEVESFKPVTHRKLKVLPYRRTG